MHLNEFATPNKYTHTPPLLEQLVICCAARRPTTSHDRCRTTEAATDRAKETLTRYERVSKSNVFVNLCCTNRGVHHCARSNRLRNSIPSSFLLTMHRTISDACAQSSSDGSFCVTIVSNARPELGIVRPIGNVRFALSSAVPTSAAIWSRDCRIIDSALLERRRHRR